MAVSCDAVRALASVRMPRIEGHDAIAPLPAGLSQIKAGDRGRNMVESPAQRHALRIITARIFMSVFKNNFVVGLTAGLAAAVVAPVLIPAVKRGSRPAAKAMLRGGMLLYQKGREAVAHTGEAVEDLLAEIQTEDVQEESASPRAGAGHLAAVQAASPAGEEPGEAGR
jgi:hypothetical protein